MSYIGLPYAQLHAIASGRTVVSPAHQPALPHGVLGGMPYAGMPYAGMPIPQYLSAYYRVFPTGMLYNGILNPSNMPSHVRIAPNDNCPVEQVFFPTSLVQVTVDPRYPTWVHITCSNGVGGTINGWVGKQHVC